MSKSSIVWRSILIEYVGQDSFDSSLDGRSRNAQVKLTNTGSTVSDRLYHNIAIQGLSNYPQVAGDGGFATFPNGGWIILEPGQSIVVQNWLQGVYETRFGNVAPLPGEEKQYTFDFLFATDNRYWRDPDPKASTEVVSLSQVLTFSNTDYNSGLDGPLELSGTVKAESSPTIEVATEFSSWYQIQPVAQGSGTYSFSAHLPDRDDWMLRVSQTGKESILVHVDPESPMYSLQLLDGEVPDVGFEVSKTFDTPTGFWRGAVSEAEGTFVIFPGQENWSLQNPVEQAAIKATSTLYKYTFGGDLLWSKETGWETWGGDMTADGSLVAYLTNADIAQTGQARRMVLLDGSNGSVLWQIDDAALASLEGLEVALSDNGRWLASGSSQGVIGIFDIDAKASIAELSIARGQVRKLVFDPDSRFLYVGSGDNYLYKLDVQTLSVVWRAEVGGWPFINGLDFTSDGSMVAVGTKSKEVTLVDTETGEVLWRQEGYMDVNIAPDDSIAVDFAGDIFSIKTGQRTGDTGSAGVVSYLQSSGKVYVVQADRQSVKVFDNTGTRIATYGDASDTEAGGGEQSQWSYLTADQQYLIVASRDMDTPGERGLTIWSVTEDAIADSTSETGGSSSGGSGLADGTMQDDVFRAHPGPQSLNGREGFDTVIYDGAASLYSLRFVGPAGWFVTSSISPSDRSL